MSSPVDLRLFELVEQVQQRKLSAWEIVTATVEQIEKLNPHLNAYLHVNTEAALSRARQLDQALASDTANGVLLGVPLALKDMFYLSDRQPTGGSAFLQSQPITFNPATVVKRLQEAGACIAGYTHMTEFAVGPTGHNVHVGACRNPFNTDYIAGGSSSGSAAAVAARMAYGGIGSDTGGSIRIPAAVTGVYGLKPTLGRVPRSGSMPLAYSLDTIGPLARHPIDLAILLGSIAGPDAYDHSASSRTLDNYLGACHQSVAGMRIGVPDSYFDQLSDAANNSITIALDTLQANGAKIVSVSVAHAVEHRDLSRALFYAEAAGIHGHWLRERFSQYSDQVGNRLLTGMAIPAMTYVEAKLLRPRLLREFVSEVFGRCDVMLTSAIAGDVPTLTETDAGGGPNMWSVIDSLLKHASGFNYLGLPALVAPVTLTPHGLPSAIQLIGRPFDESALLTVASTLEQMSGFSKIKPPLS